MTPKKNFVSQICSLKSPELFSAQLFSGPKPDLGAKAKKSTVLELFTGNERGQKRGKSSQLIIAISTSKNTHGYPS
jgi:hypothetical protein